MRVPVLLKDVNGNVPIILGTYDSPPVKFDNTLREAFLSHCQGSDLSKVNAGRVVSRIYREVGSKKCDRAIGRAL